MSLKHPDAWRICPVLAEDADVIFDSGTDRLRIGPHPAYTRFFDVWGASIACGELVLRSEYRVYNAQALRAHADAERPSPKEGATGE